MPSREPASGLHPSALSWLGWAGGPSRLSGPGTSRTAVARDSRQRRRVQPAHLTSPHSGPPANRECRVSCSSTPVATDPMSCVGASDWLRRHLRPNARRGPSGMHWTPTPIVIVKSPSRETPTGAAGHHGTAVSMSSCGLVHDARESVICHTRMSMVSHNHVVIGADNPEFVALRRVLG